MRARDAGHDFRSPLPEPDALLPASLLGLVAAVPVGRLAFTVHGRPAVSVVRHVVVGGGLLMRSGHHPDLVAAARAEQVVAFEADDVEGEAGFGWWVTALGRVRLLDGEAAAGGRVLLMLDVTWMNGYVLPDDQRQRRAAS